MVSNRSLLFVPSPWVLRSTQESRTTSPCARPSPDTGRCWDAAAIETSALLLEQEHASEPASETLSEESLGQRSPRCRVECTYTRRSCLLKSGRGRDRRQRFHLRPRIRNRPREYSGTV